MLLLSYCSVFKVQNCYAILPTKLRFVCANSAAHKNFQPFIAYAKFYYIKFCKLGRCSYWWAWEDSNLRPHAYQACALTTWATSPFDFRRPVVVSVFRRPVVEMRRIELLTPCLQGRCSPSWATPPYFNLSIDAGTSEFVFLFSTFWRYTIFRLHPLN